MKKRIIFPILLFIFPFVISAQTTAKEWYNKGVELKDKKEYEEALAAFKNAITKKAITAKPIIKQAGAVMNWKNMKMLLTFEKIQSSSDEYRKEINTMNLVFLITVFKMQKMQLRIQKNTCFISK